VQIVTVESVMLNGNWELAKLFQATGDPDRTGRFGKLVEIGGQL
jgi:hypothetical protein